ncbi:BnaCnng29220D [Brassica napus]|uniref:BnaCnng29220D protein n=1 Tax=Brassica napus TaxID=3708 RepID=A0A078IW26_BRANA|nr:BnaCnng29220D [Brassica napus]
MSLCSILCFVLISFHVASVSALVCWNNRVFTPNDTYDANRRLILSYLPSNVTAQNGLNYNSSIGQEPNRIYATGMCIPGSDLVECSECIRTTSDALIQRCQNRTEAYAWPHDPTLCYVRYSNTSFLGSLDLNPRANLTNGANVTSDLTEFRKIWEDLAVRMIDAASTSNSTPSSSDNYYTANTAALNPFQEIYALMQCTPDLSSSDCKTCLRESVRHYRDRRCCNTRQGTRVWRPSCYFRMEMYTFSKASFVNFSSASPPPHADDQGSKINNEDSKGLSAGIVVAITVSTVVGVLILFVLGYVQCLERKLRGATETVLIIILLLSNQLVNTKQKQVSSVFIDYAKVADIDISTRHSSQYDFKTIEAATNNFSRSNKLGEGGFGEVYKGTLSNGTEVAVKRLSKMSGQGTREFRNEAVLVSKLQHRNLVRLLGFCLEGEEKILIYEFVPNKSLDYFLFDPEKQGQLDWTQRYKIIGGIARGILYLHQDSELTIIHRDLKASNILLDADMNPKISDFGLSTIFGIDQTQGNTNRIAGTYAYMSPEYALQGQFSMKSDVYSFGVLVLEIISGKKNSNVYQMDETSTAGNLVNNAWRLWRNGSPLELSDSSIRRNHQSNEVTRCIHIALLCVQDNPEDRPMLSTIILMLTSNTITLPVPQLPSFFPRSMPEFGQVSESSRSTVKSVSYSISDTTITELEPR